MTCNEYQEWISAYVDNELDEERAAPLFAHLGACTECRGFFRDALQLRSVIQDDILMQKEEQISQHIVPEREQHFSLALPFVAILFALFLWLGVVQTSRTQAPVQPVAPSGLIEDFQHVDHRQPF